jgi:S-methylmethionine-dependent homocysteine/selenocysteine methylase
MSHMPAFAHGDYRPDPAAAASHYREIAELLADAGCDLIIAEMMMLPGHAEAVVEAAVASGLPVWIGFSVRIAPDGRVVMFDDDPAGQGSETVFGDFAPGVLARGGTVAGIMHSEVDETEPGLRALRSVWDGPLLAYAHSGDWAPPNWGFDHIIEPGTYAEACAHWVETFDIQVVGGCCGTGPDHVRALRAVLGGF